MSDLTALADTIERHVHSVLGSPVHAHGMVLSGKEWVVVIVALRTVAQLTSAGKD